MKKNTVAECIFGLLIIVVSTIGGAIGTNLIDESVGTVADGIRESKRAKELKSKELY